MSPTSSESLEQVLRLGEDSMTQQRDNLGFGVPELVRLMRERGFKEPTIEVLGGHFKLVLWTTREAA
jgi:hypothetical protein